MEIDGNTSKNCVICKFTGGTNETINGVNAYIIDSIGSVDLNEIVKQVTEAMVASDIPITEDQVRRHVRDHVKHQKVIMHQTLNDLVSLSRLTKKSCVFDCPESGCRQVDPKMLASYLKIIDQIVTVYRMDSMKEGPAK
tara:strand:- start:10979 stop:11395 length:417 start_codon:yes stop_codon:yes gene_type:complete